MKKNKKEKIIAADYVYGIHPVIELLKSRRRSVHRIYVSESVPRAFGQIKPLISDHVPVSFVKRDLLARLSGSTDHQGIVALTVPFFYRKKMFNPKESPFILLVDSVQDTRNLGAILRSAYCTGVSGVVTAGKQSAPINSSTCKASAGLVEHLEIYKDSTAINAARELTSAGYNLYAGALGGENVMNVDFKKPCCIVVGNEAIGISPAILKMGTVVMLPQKKADISYNASVAAGLLLFIAATKNNVI